MRVLAFVAIHQSKRIAFLLAHDSEKTIEAFRKKVTPAQNTCFLTKRTLAADSHLLRLPSMSDVVPQGYQLSARAYVRLLAHD
jgi:hypothetical protein